MRLAAILPVTRSFGALRAVGAAGVAVLFVAVAATAFFAGRAGVRSSETPPPVAIHATPGVITAIHDVARLETTEFHIEKVVEASQAQSKLWGLVEAKDALLLVAVGDVVAGVDLGGVRDEDVRIDGADARSITVRLPPPQILSARLDENATHVYARTTDALATRSEQLEGEARRSAEEQMQKAARDAGILDRARAGTEQTLRALLRSLGYERVDIDWRDRS